MFLISCYHPAFIQRYFDANTGAFSSKWIGGAKALLDSPIFKDALKREFSGEKSLYDYSSIYIDYNHSILQVPCGKCIGCRMDYSRSWADRMTYHVIGKEKHSFFLTLTYDDDHIDDLDHSPVYDLYALNYDHVRSFIKDLRNRFRGCGLDFYYSGEYGSSTFRPHIHMILYNCPLDDLEFWKLNDNGDPVYTSDTIHKLWKRGICSVSKFSWRGAAYTASYVEKKRDGRAMIEYTAVGLTPEKCGCSRRPGIAYDYYQDHFHDIWKNDGLSVDRTVNSSGKLGIPRYFRKLAEKGVGYHDFIDWQKRSLDRQNVLNPHKLYNSSFDLDSIEQMLLFEERELLSKQVAKKL